MWPSQTAESITITRSDCRAFVEDCAMQEQLIRRCTSPRHSQMVFRRTNLSLCEYSIRRAVRSKGARPEADGLFVHIWAYVWRADSCHRFSLASKGPPSLPVQCQSNFVLEGGARDGPRRGSDVRKPG